MTLGQLFDNLVDEDGTPRLITYAEACELALVFTQPLAARLAELWQLHGSDKCKPVPFALVDGRLMLRAALLTEIQPGGLLHAMWEAADKSILLSHVDVLPMEQALAMLPPSPPMPPMSPL